MSSRRLPDCPKPPKSLVRTFDVTVLSYAAALLIALPFLVWYIDGPMKGFIVSVQSDWGLQVATVITAVGYGLTDAGIAAVLFGLGRLTGRPREAVAGKLGLFAVIVSGLSGQVLKNLFCRARPLTEQSGEFFVEFPCLGKGAGFISFPSGHSVTAFALAFVLARSYPRYAVPLYGLAVLVALSRVYLAKHFPSDVVAGAVVGILSGWFVCRLAAPSSVHEYI